MFPVKTETAQTIFDLCNVSLDNSKVVLWIQFEFSGLSEKGPRKYYNAKLKSPRLINRRDIEQIYNR